MYNEIEHKKHNILPRIPISAPLFSRWLSFSTEWLWSCPEAAVTLKIVLLWQDNITAMVTYIIANNMYILSLVATPHDDGGSRCKHWLAAAAASAFRCTAGVEGWWEQHNPLTFAPTPPPPAAPHITNVCTRAQGRAEVLIRRRRWRCPLTFRLRGCKSRSISSFWVLLFLVL